MSGAPGSRAGREPDSDHAGEGGAAHGIAAPRGLGEPPGAQGGRFTTLFPWLPRRHPGPEAITALAERLEAAASVPSGENTRIPAGYTYLGQFIDHDITFDATSKIDQDNDPHALVNFRTPRMDLDSLYGSGPADQPFLYDWASGEHDGAKLLIGHNRDKDSARIDLPRNEQGRALTGDARNDENLVISQLHLLFVKFHNRVVEHLHGRDRRLTGNALFEAAHETVRWHYQWIVARDFLRRVVGDEMWNGLLARLEVQPGAIRRASLGWDAPAIPIEFSAAAYRFGHSMVRRGYSVSSDSGSVHILRLPGDDEHDPDLSGFRRLPSALEITWSRFFGSSPSVFSMRIDHRLAQGLFHLPPDHASLALLNLQRGGALGLPCGADVARAMGEDPLSEAELFPVDGGARGPDHTTLPFWPDDVSRDERDAIADATPLWFYLLREADARVGPPEEPGTHLGPIGGRIVAEVLVGLLEADRSSYLHAPEGWRPWLTGDDFTMANLVDFTLGGDHRPAGGDGP